MLRDVCGSLWRSDGRAEVSVGPLQQFGDGSGFGDVVHLIVCGAAVAAVAATASSSWVLLFLDCAVAWTCNNLVECFKIVLYFSLTNCYYILVG